MASEGDYKPSWLAELFHSFPHLDLTFQTVNSTFNPHDARYREALVFWAAIPVLWLLVTLLIFLMYFCYRCCQKDVEEKKTRATCLKWSMAILALLTCAAVGVGFYGNEEANKGIHQFIKSASDGDDTVKQMRLKPIIENGEEKDSLVTELQKNINETIEQGVQGLRQVFRTNPNIGREDKVRLSVSTQTALDHARSILSNIHHINGKADKVDLSDAVYYAKEYGFYRWIGLILLLCWEIFLCLLILLAIGKSSKCTLLMFCAFGIFTLVLCWICAGFHLGLSVGMGDFCDDPKAFFEKLSENDVEKRVLNYYLMCTAESVLSNPFSGALKSALDSVTSANESIRQSDQMALGAIGSRNEYKQYIDQLNRGFDKTVVNIQQLTALVECTNLHKDYEDGIEGACDMALPGFVFLLLSATGTGLLLTILVLMASCAWRHIGKSYIKGERKENTDVKGYTVVDDDEPRLSIPDNSSPTYYSFSRQRQGNPREHVPMQRRGSPPPAPYNPAYVCGVQVGSNHTTDC